MEQNKINKSFIIEKKIKLFYSQGEQNNLVKLKKILKMHANE